MGTVGAWVTEYLPEQKRLRAHAFWLNRAFVENFEYPIAGTACAAAVEEKKLIHIPDRLLELYPGIRFRLPYPPPEYEAMSSTTAIPIQTQLNPAMGGPAVFPELPREIAKARAHGDLSENAEYHAAKERQRFVDSRLAQLKGRLRAVSMVDMARIPKDRVGLGSRVVVLDTQKDVRITLARSKGFDADDKEAIWVWDTSVNSLMFLAAPCAECGADSSSARK
jgi:hypothetical protein